MADLRIFMFAELANITNIGEFLRQNMQKTDRDLVRHQLLGGHHVFLCLGTKEFGDVADLQNLSTKR